MKTNYILKIKKNYIFKRIQNSCLVLIRNWFRFVIYFLFLTRMLAGCWSLFHIKHERIIDKITATIRTNIIIIKTHHNDVTHEWNFASIIQYICAQIWQGLSDRLLVIVHKYYTIINDRKCRIRTKIKKKDLVNIFVHSE